MVSFRNYGLTDLGRREDSSRGRDSITKRIRSEKIGCSIKGPVILLDVGLRLYDTTKKRGKGKQKLKDEHLNQEKKKEGRNCRVQRFNV